MHVWFVRIGMFLAKLLLCAALLGVCFLTVYVLVWIPWAMHTSWVFNLGAHEEWVEQVALENCRPAIFAEYAQEPTRECIEYWSNYYASLPCSEFKTTTAPTHLTEVKYVFMGMKSLLFGKPCPRVATPFVTIFTDDEKSWEEFHLGDLTVGSDRLNYTTFFFRHLYLIRSMAQESFLALYRAAGTYWRSVTEGACLLLYNADICVGAKAPASFSGWLINFFANDVIVWLFFWFLHIGALFAAQNPYVVLAALALYPYHLSWSFITSFMLLRILENGPIVGKWKALLFFWNALVPHFAFYFDLWWCIFLATTLFHIAFSTPYWTLMRLFGEHHPELPNKYEWSLVVFIWVASLAWLGIVVNPMWLTLVVGIIMFRLFYLRVRGPIRHTQTMYTNADGTTTRSSIQYVYPSTTGIPIFDVFIDWLLGSGTVSVDEVPSDGLPRPIPRQPPPRDTHGGRPQARVPRDIVTNRDISAPTLGVSGTPPPSKYGVVSPPAPPAPVPTPDFPTIAQGLRVAKPRLYSGIPFVSGGVQNPNPSTSSLLDSVDVFHSHTASDLGEDKGKQHDDSGAGVGLNDRVGESPTSDHTVNSSDLKIHPSTYVLATDLIGMSADDITYREFERKTVMLGSEFQSPKGGSGFSDPNDARFLVALFDPTQIYIGTGVVCENHILCTDHQIDPSQCASACFVFPEKGELFNLGTARQIPIAKDYYSVLCFKIPAGVKIARQMRLSKTPLPTSGRCHVMGIPGHNPWSKSFGVAFAEGMFHRSAIDLVVKAKYSSLPGMSGGAVRVPDAGGNYGSILSALHAFGGQLFNEFIILTPEFVDAFRNPRNAVSDSQLRQAPAGFEPETTAGPTYVAPGVARSNAVKKQRYRTHFYAPNRSGWLSYDEAEKEFMDLYDYIAELYNTRDAKSTWLAFKDHAFGLQHPDEVEPDYEGEFTDKPREFKRRDKGDITTQNEDREEKIAEVRANKLMKKAFYEAQAIGDDWFNKQVDNGNTSVTWADIEEVEQDYVRSKTGGDIGAGARRRGKQAQEDQQHYDRVKGRTEPRRGQGYPQGPEFKVPKWLWAQMSRDERAGFNRSPPHPVGTQKKMCTLLAKKYAKHAPEPEKVGEAPEKLVPIARGEPDPVIKAVVDEVFRKRGVSTAPRTDTVGLDPSIWTALTKQQRRSFMAASLDEKRQQKADLEEAIRSKRNGGDGISVPPPLNN